VENLLNGRFVPPTRGTLIFVLDAHREPAGLTAADGIDVHRIVRRDARKSVAPAFPEGDTRIQRVTTTMPATDGIGAREGILVVVAPLVEDDVVVVLVRVVVGVAQHEN